MARYDPSPYNDPNNFARMRLGIALLVVGRVAAENVKIEDLDVAITAASGGEELAVSAGTYTKTMESSAGSTRGIYIEGKTMSIVGEGSDLSILDGGSDHGVVYVGNVGYMSSGKVVFDGLAIRNGKSYGGDGFGSGMYIVRSDVEISNMLFENNDAGGNTGGGVYLGVSTMLMERCILRSNTANYGGGLSVNSGVATLIGNTFESNTAISTGYGDDIHNNYGPVTVHGCGTGTYGTKGAALDTNGAFEGEPFSYSCSACER